MEDFAMVAAVAIVLGVVPGIIVTVYFVKIARRLTGLLDVLKRETEWRIREKYELPGPMPLPRGTE